MNINLTAELEQMVEEKVKSGRYSSPAEVLREALHLLADRDELMEVRKRELNEKIASAQDSLRRGEGIDGEEFFAALEREEQELILSLAR